MVNEGDRCTGHDPEDPLHRRIFEDIIREAGDVQGDKKEDEHQK